MKRIQYLALLLSLAAFLSLAGTGFSIWYNFTPVNVTLGGDGENPAKLNAYVVDRSNDYIAPDPSSGTGISIFNYSALSFTNAQGEATPTGSITVDYLLQVPACRAAFGNSLTLSFVLSYENALSSSLFSTAGLSAGEVKSITATVNGEAVTPGNTGARLTLQKDLDISAATGDTLRVQVVYTFTIPQCYDTDGDGNYNEKNAEGTYTDTVGNFRNLFGRYLQVANDAVNTTGTTTFITEASVAKKAA